MDASKAAKKASTQRVTGQFPTHPTGSFLLGRKLNRMIRKFFGCIREEVLGWRFAAAPKITKGPLRYCRPGIVSVNPARRNALAIASPLANPGLLDPAQLSPDRRRVYDSVGSISVLAVVRRASGA
jgi:hypothetical protein